MTTSIVSRLFIYTAMAAVVAGAAMPHPGFALATKARATQMVNVASAGASGSGSQLYR